MKRGDRIMALITGAGALMMAAGLLMRGPENTASARTAEIVVGGQVLHQIALTGRPREIRVDRLFRQGESVRGERAAAGTV